MKTSERTSLVNPFRVMKVLERARQLEVGGRKIVHMEVGEPDFTTAAPIVEAAKSALDRGHTHYSNAPGISSLREAIADFYQARHDVVVEPERIFITPGASGGLNLLANLLIEPGDGILMADPAYPCNRNFIRLMGGMPQLIPVGPDSRYQPTAALLDQHKDDSTRGLWLASPANPTGTAIDRATLGELLSVAHSNQFHVLMDEIYHGLHYIDAMPSLLEMSDESFVVNSFSKYFGMTGWRIGWIVVPGELTEIVEVLAQNLFIAASTIAQHAALAAFEPATIEILQSRREAFHRRRDFLYDALTSIGFQIPARPDGAFYLYADISRFSDDSEAFCQTLLEEHFVALTPGTDFGEHEARRHVRFAFTTSMDDLELGVERLARALEGWG